MISLLFGGFFLILTQEETSLFERQELAAISGSLVGLDRLLHPGLRS